MQPCLISDLCLNYILALAAEQRSGAASCKPARFDLHLPLQGYTAQSELVYAGLDALLGSCAARRESVVIEGVLLSMDSIMRLMAKHRTIIPFLIHISNEAKHRERFAVSPQTGCQMTWPALSASMHVKVV